MLCSWVHLGTVPPLRADEVQVWRIDAGSLPDAEKVAAYAVLSPPERERAVRLRAGREEFIAGRAGLRCLLGAALQQQPREIALAVGEHGKPRLADDAGISFNVAHSRGKVLLALTRGGDVGVDVEYIDPSIEALDIARSSFHPADVARMEKAATSQERTAEFYRCWTRKEAVAKADGRGLTLELTGFATGADDDREQPVLLPDRDGVRLRPYYSRGVKAGNAHIAALASTEPAIPMILLDFCQLLGGFANG